MRGTRANSIHIGGDSMAFGAVYGPPFVREGEVRRDATMEDFRELLASSRSRSPCWTRPGGVVCEPNDTPLDSRHLDMTYALQTLTDKIVHGQRRLRGQRRRHDRDGRDPVRRARRHRGEAGVDLADQLQLAAAVGRPDARRAVRVLGRQPAGRAHAVPTDGRHVAGDDSGRARAADRRGTVGDRAQPADPAGLPGDLRVVPVQHRHAVRARRRSAPPSRRSGCCAPARSPGTSGCRSAPAAG